MTIDFNKLRTRKGTNFDALQRSLEKSGGGGGYKKDERIWKPTKKDGKSSNIIRFLPIPAIDFQHVEDGKFAEVDLTPRIQVMSHAFQGVAGWYIENSLSTFNEPCPVREYDAPLWSALKKLDDKLPSSKATKEILKKRIQKTTMYVNILVIKDGEKPENNGKVFLYELPVTIDNMIKAADKPQFETSPRFDPFDIATGANLMLNILYVQKTIGDKQVDAPDWKNVQWAPCSPMCDGDEKQVEAIWRQEHSLLDFHDRKHFKTYDELKAKFCKCMGMDLNYNPLQPGSTLGSSAEKFAQEKPAVTASVMPKSANVPAQTASVPESTQPVADAPDMSSGTDEEDPLLEFERMMNEEASAG